MKEIDLGVEAVQELESLIDDAEDLTQEDMPVVVDTVEELKQHPKKERSHMTKEEWEAKGRDPEKWKSKDQFDKDGSFFEKIESQKDYIKKLEDKINKLEKESNDRKKQEYEYQKSSWEQHKDQARLNSQVDEYAFADEQLRRLQPPEVDEQPTSPYSPEVVKAHEDFLERNSDWYNTDSIENMLMTGRAEELATALRPGIESGKFSMIDAMHMIEDQIQKEYAHRFSEDESLDSLSSLKKEIQETKEELKAVSRVEPPSPPRRGGKSTINDIPAEFREVYKAGIAAGIEMTPKEYLDSLRGK